MSRVRSSCRVSASGTPRVRVRSSPLARLLRWLARVARLDMRKPGESRWGYISWLSLSFVLSALLLIVGPEGNANTASVQLRFSRLVEAQYLFTYLGCYKSICRSVVLFSLSYPVQTWKATEVREYRSTLTSSVMGVPPPPTNHCKNSYTYVNFQNNSLMNATWQI